MIITSCISNLNIWNVIEVCFFHVRQVNFWTFLAFIGGIGTQQRYKMKCGSQQLKALRP